MNRLLPAVLIGMGMAFAAVAHAGAAAAPAGDDGAARGDLETRETGEDLAGDAPQDEIDALKERLRYRLAIIDGSIDEYIDGPTDAWRDRVSLHRLA